jgi:hypothetical protein
MDAVVLFGTALIDDPDRFGAVAAVGLDETLFAREGPYRFQRWSTQIVDVSTGQLLDVVATSRHRAVPLVRGASETWRPGSLGDVGSVGVVSGGVRHHAP